jgi:lipopolysaccharide/colanic/teichoic acid biosynthesis glycosyltransferase
MFDLKDAQVPYIDVGGEVATGGVAHRGYLVCKRVFDVTFAIILLVPLAFSLIMLAFLNRRFNPGPMFYVQTRMGRHCQPFSAIKLRTMLETDAINRGPFDELEHDRITTLGRFLRKSRLDELPQMINVLKGEMSLIGPRPDYVEHAKVYVETVPGYRERHSMRPGISGFAQTEVGYVDGLESLRQKVEADLFYIRNASFRFDAWIVWRTIVVVLLRRGA